MANGQSLVFAGIAPHPPIMVPEVGREAIAEVRASIDGMSRLTERVIDAGAETIIMISPHAALEANAFVAYDGPQLFGDFSMFRAPTATVHGELDDELLTEITRVSSERGLLIHRIRGFDLDHGTAVPLYFLQRNGWTGRVIAFGYTFLSNEDHLQFGRCIKQAIEKVGRPTAFIASGDLSHRLKRDAPAGYNPDAHLFDEEVVAAFRGNAPAEITNIDQDLRRLAGECGYRSMLVAVGASEGVDSDSEVISYEAPFGVGYLVAQVFSTRAAAASALSSNREEATPSNEPAQPASSARAEAELKTILPALARQAIEAFITTGKIIDPPKDSPEFLKARAACFVSVKTLSGDLRGCIGTFEPIKDSLAEELIANAVSAATRDPRFRPIDETELAGLKYSVDVLSAPEPAIFSQLDPNRYGLIIEDLSGNHRGLLLPNLEGVETAAQQVEITRRKAGINPNAEVRLYRFRTDRYSE